MSFTIFTVTRFGETRAVTRTIEISEISKARTISRPKTKKDVRRLDIIVTAADLVQ
jgi:hypothetical protein